MRRKFFKRISGFKLQEKKDFTTIKTKSKMPMERTLAEERLSAMIRKVMEWEKSGCVKQDLSRKYREKDSEGKKQSKCKRQVQLTVAEVWRQALVIEKRKEKYNF